MLRNNLKSVSVPALLIFIAAAISGCNNDSRKPDISAVNVLITTDRLENDLQANTNISFLKQKYGSFFDLYCYQLLQLGTSDTALLKTRLEDFVNDPDILNITADAKKMYADFGDVNQKLTTGFQYYRYYFPEKIIPRIITYVSGFNYAIVCADSSLGIGLDMYLGSDSKYYPSLQMPEYKIRKMQRAYIAADAIKGWAQSEWEQDPAQIDLISQMIYHGKIQYFLDRMLPDEPDSIKFGYTEQQVAWCLASERSIWSFLVDNKLLFSTIASQIGKFVNEGPTTNGFPKESPGNIGAWVGYRIVKSYMEKHSGISLMQLMAENDAKKIFRDSNYKPEK